GSNPGRMRHEPDTYPLHHVLLIVKMTKKITSELEAKLKERGYTDLKSTKTLLIEHIRIWILISIVNLNLLVILLLMER
ncbi:hypothetical protein, partial [Wolbachia endosymbiont of Atemnus politus]|uniref:hypothetical protein n=1 Tax=Wolbachia endosymbiont of Atemnus politus TaxID=2682840 RepID=UPI0034E300E3